MFVDIVKFDNSYSWLHNKKLWYNVDVTEPATDLPPSATDLPSFTGTS